MLPAELYIVLNSPINVPGDIVEAYILAHASNPLSLEVEVLDYKGLITHANIELDRNEHVVHAFEFQAPKIPGKYELILRSKGRVLDRAIYAVVGNYEDYKDRYVAFVWHHHQPPNYLPDGTYYYAWAFKHVYDDELAPYGKGPYHYHAVLLNKYPDYRCTYNLSPSLITQWINLIERGVVFKNGLILDKDGLEAKLVNEVLELYKKSVYRNQIDVLTSIYAHTIAGYVLEYLYAEDLIKEEVEYGVEVTKKVIGIDPKGVWTPEMAFSMKLIDIYSDLGLEYTVLDAKCHLEKSDADRKNVLEPYIAKGSRGEILLFFRETELSNNISFKNNFKNELHAWKQAYDVATSIAEKIKFGGVLTIALDGENWMIFSKKPGLTAVFYDKLVNYLVSLQRIGYLETTTLREVLNKYPRSKKIQKIPTTTWLCGFTKWHGEVEDHSSYWEKAKRTYEHILNYEKIHGNDTKSRKARWALWHALDSDYWWAEFWDPYLIDTWLCEAEKEIGVELPTCMTARRT